MIILRETTDEQEIFFIPRSFVFNKVIVKNEETGISQEFTVTAQQSNQYGYVKLVLDLKEDDWYVFKVYNDENLLYYGRVFCTNQEIETFSINKDVYTAPAATNNDFIRV